MTEINKTLSEIWLPMKKCCLCCLQTTSSPKNEFNSISYASLMPQELCMLFQVFQVYRRDYIYVENGITLNYQNQWLNIYSYDYFILSDHLVLSNDLRGHTLRPRQTELSSSLYLIHYDEANIEITIADTDDMKARQVYRACLNENMFPKNTSGIVSALLDTNSIWKGQLYL